MKNYLFEFVQTNGRKPTQDEVGSLMYSVAKSEHGRVRTNGYMDRYILAKKKGSLGGRRKTPIALSENAIKINNLLLKGYSKDAIEVILKLKPASIRSIIRKQSLPRNKDMILNYKSTEMCTQGGD